MRVPKLSGGGIDLGKFVLVRDVIIQFVWINIYLCMSRLQTMFAWFD